MNNRDLLKRFVDIAQAEVGVREVGGNNCGDRIREYQSATWLAPGAWPWCAAFVAWCLREWLQEEGVADALKLHSLSAWRCRDASAFGWEKWAKANKLKVLTETEKAKAGDLVIFDFSHIGIVAEDQHGDFIKTIEGNTNGKGERDSVSGDGVWNKIRQQALTKCYIRLLA